MSAAVAVANTNARPATVRIGVAQWRDRSNEMRYLLASIVGTYRWSASLTIGDRPAAGVLPDTEIGRIDACVERAPREMQITIRFLAKGGYTATLAERHGRDLAEETVVAAWDEGDEPLGVMLATGLECAHA